MGSCGIDFKTSMDGVSDKERNSSFGRDARCPHAASDNEDPAARRLKQVFSRWATLESERRMGAVPGM